MRKLNYSLRDLDRTLEQPGDNPLRDAHARLDAAVRAAYGMPDDADPQTKLLGFIGRDPFWTAAKTSRV